MRKKFKYRTLCEFFENRILLSSAAPIGVNLEPLTDWARSFAFVDVVKQARGFGSPTAPWDGSAPIDANGWPTADFGAVLITINGVSSPIQDTPPIDGVYHLTATGNATITPLATDATVNQHYDPRTNTLTADITLSPGAQTFYLAFTNTDRGDGTGGLTNLRILRPGYPANTKLTFTTAFVNSLAPFTTLRTMDFTATNDNLVADWADRSHTTDARQATVKGTAWEYVIQLANQAKKDLWINIPAHATDDYILQLATLLKKTFSSKRHIYLEYSNEVWNRIFDAGNSNYNQAQIDAANDPSFLNYDNINDANAFAWRRYVEVFEHTESLFAQVYGRGMMNIVRPVLASQAVWAYVPKIQLEFVNHFYGPPAKTIWAIAGGPYIGVGDDSNNPNLTVDGVINHLTTEIALIKPDVERYDALATFYGVRNLSYEGGINLIDDIGGNFGNAKLPANYDPRIQSVITQYLTALMADGSQQLMYFNNAGALEPSGTFGLTENINNIKGFKYAAITQFARSRIPAVVAGNILPASAAAGPLTIDAAAYTLDQWGQPGSTGDLFAPPAGATFDYLLNVTRSNRYSVTTTIASTNSAGVLELILDNTILGTLNIPDTGGADVALPPVDLATSLRARSLTPGLHTLRLVVATPGFDIHNMSFQISQGSTKSSLPGGLPSMTVPGFPVLHSL